jgi:hypothetical protein
VDERCQRLLATIEEAFRGVELGDGVSLHETVVIDDYGTDQQRRAAREPDEKHDWRRLVGDPELARIGGVGGPSFYDAAGLRFHLPAYLSLAVIAFDRADADLALESLMFTLTHFSEYNAKRLSILNDAQRHCVREVLSFLRSEHELESAELDEAIDGYWSRGPDAARQPEPGTTADGPSTSS